MFWLLVTVDLLTQLFQTHFAGNHNVDVELEVMALKRSAGSERVISQPICVIFLFRWSISSDQDHESTCARLALGGLLYSPLNQPLVLSLKTNLRYFKA